MGEKKKDSNTVNKETYRWKWIVKTRLARIQNQNMKKKKAI